LVLNIGMIFKLIKIYSHTKNISRQQNIELKKKKHVLHKYNNDVNH
jgi:hypothetical protein